MHFVNISLYLKTVVNHVQLLTVHLFLRGILTKLLIFELAGIPA